MVAAQKDSTLPLKILVDHATYMASKKDVAYQTKDPIFVKGKANQISIYNPINPLEVCLHRPICLSKGIECVGRAEILDHINNIIDSLARTTQPTAVMLAGPPGIGILL